MPDLATRLARKWCPQHQEGGTTLNVCSCPQTAAAIREALEEAEKIATEEANEWMRSLTAKSPESAAIHTQQIRDSNEATARKIAATLAALRERE